HRRPDGREGGRRRAGRRRRASPQRPARAELRQLVCAFDPARLRRGGAVAAALAHVSGGPARSVREPSAEARGRALARRPPRAAAAAPPAPAPCGRRPCRDTERRGRLAARRRGLPPARRRRLRVDGQRPRARPDPGRGRRRRYHHGRSADPSVGFPSEMKRIALPLLVLLAAGPLGLRASVDVGLFRTFAAKLANRFARKPVASRLLLRNDKPFVTKSVTGRKIDQPRTVRDLSDELVHGTRTTIKLQAKFTKP